MYECALQIAAFTMIMMYLALMALGGFIYWCFKQELTDQP